jgi:hypothetical protein
MQPVENARRAKQANGDGIADLCADRLIGSIAQIGPCRKLHLA